MRQLRSIRADVLADVLVLLRQFRAREAHAGRLQNLFLRSLRARGHMDSVINSTRTYEFEQLEIGHGAGVNALVCLSPQVIVCVASARLHRILIAPGATLWRRAIVLGESWVPSGPGVTQLGPLSRMARASTAMALEQLQRRRHNPSMPSHLLRLVGVPAWCHLQSGLSQEGEADCDATLGVPSRHEAVGAEFML